MRHSNPILVPSGGPMSILTTAVAVAILRTVAIHTIQWSDNAFVPTNPYTLGIRAVPRLVVLAGSLAFWV